MEKFRAILYPYDISLIHMITYSNTFTEFEITSVASPAGWGYVGEDAGQKLGVHTGIPVVEDVEPLLDKVDVVLFVASILPLEESIFENFSKIATRNGKKILDIRNGTDKTIGNFRKFDPAVKYYQNKATEAKNEPKLLKIDKSIVLILGTGQRTCKFDVQLLTHRYFLEQGYKVTQVGSKNYCECFGFHSFPTFMYENIPVSEKIVLFNHYIASLSHDEDSDVLIIGVPGGIAPLNDTYLNDFGVINFMVSNSIQPDYIVLNTTFVDYNVEYINSVTNSLQYKYGYDVDAVFLSNYSINWEATESFDALTYITLNREFVKNEAKRCHVYSVYDETSCSAYRDHLLTTLTGYGDYATI